MNGTGGMSFSLKDLGMAYRKAKVDLYYTTLPPLTRISEYESNLVGNLNSLRERLNGVDESWLNDPEFLGGWTVTAKSLDRLDQNQGDSESTVFSDANREWDVIQKAGSGCCTARLRLMANVSIDFHVLSALWISEVGHKFDNALSDNAYGSRLRRTANDKFNKLSLGSFKPYLRPFKQWRDSGIVAMKQALDDGKSIAALTADIASFYHELQPDFALGSEFQDICGVALDNKRSRLNRLFITALNNWTRVTPARKGLPVGLPASAVLANMALIELDRVIERECSPIYYGRYVDDILLVLENHQDFTSISEIWRWLFKRAPKLLGWSDTEGDAQFKPNYLHNSKVVFKNSKNKAFILNGASGRTLVDSIEQQIHQRASEWRSLPELPGDVAHVATALASATQSDGETADNLRKTSSMSRKRAGFAIKLRDYEAYARDLDPDAWVQHRHAFFDAVIEHIIVPDAFFDLCTYIPRVIRMATACEDFDWLGKIVERIGSLLEIIDEHCAVHLSAGTEVSKPTAYSESDLMSRWRQQLFRSFEENIAAAMPMRVSRAGKSKWAVFEKFAVDRFPDPRIRSLREIQEWHMALYCCDLAQTPFRFIGLPKEMVSGSALPFKKQLSNFSDGEEPIAREVFEGCEVLARWTRLKTPLPRAFLFATRPYSMPELYIVAGRKALTEKGIAEFSVILLALRGFSPGSSMPTVSKTGNVIVPLDEKDEKVSVAVTSWQTRPDSIVAAITKRSDPDDRRYSRLNRLINDVISRPLGASYLVLPELAMKPRWFVRTALKLQGRRISLITGIEYLHARRRQVRNQVWAALSHDGLGFPSMYVYMQDKQIPALHERSELNRLAKIEMQPAERWASPPVVEHGDFHFALLVCSELTNIAYRASLRGEVDAVFVPEWNQDIGTFNSLVESAALDIHAYIIQCNDRTYGDSRIRSPSKDSWKRDILRVRGGREDYCVSAEIDIHALRQFQSSYFSPDGPFKPKPDGFRMSHARKMLPK